MELTNAIERLDLENLLNERTYSVLLCLPTWAQEIEEIALYMNSWDGLFTPAAKAAKTHGKL